MSAGAGALRARVALQRPLRADDAMGGAAVTFEPAGSVWAQITARSARIGPAYDGLAVRADYELTVRAGLEVRPGWRVVWAGRVLRVEAVRDGGGPRKTLSCVEETLP